VILMTSSVNEIITHLLRRLRQVQKNFGMPATSDTNTRLADAVDSMGLVEFVGVLAEDFGVSPEMVDEAVARKYGTIADVARCLQAAGLMLPPVPMQSTADANQTKEFSRDATRSVQPKSMAPSQDKNALGWLVSTAARLPDQIQTAAEMNDILGRPPGWLESHAGIRQRRLWGNQVAVAAACEAAHECLSRTKLAASEVSVLLVTSEAPPMPVGLAAALHHQLGLGPEAVALEVGGACTGFLATWWTAMKILPSAPVILVISIESHSQYLALGPGPAGEAAALFGDAAAACVLCDQPVNPTAVPIRAIVHRSDGSGARLLQVERGRSGLFELRMQGVALAGRAVRAMAQSVRDLVEGQGLKVTDLAAVVVHGGNGRLPNLIALQLDLPPERIWSQTANTGNLGSASLPVAWALQPRALSGPVAWTAVGAGLTWAAALTGG